MTPIPIESADDPRIEAYRDIRERDLVGRRGLFVAEGEVVLNVLASPQARHRPLSALIAAHRIEGLAGLLERLPQGTPVYAASQPVIDAVAGFHLHRGILALGERATEPGVVPLLADLTDQAVVVVVSGVGNHDNMGGIFRNAAAFGAGAVLLDDRCCDPLYRKAIRVSVGAVLRTPFSIGEPVSAILDQLEAAGFDLLALSPSATEPLSGIRTARRTALILGSEGPGLDEEVMARCRRVGIPMAGGFDSLNVAATSAVALYQLTQV